MERILARALGQDLTQLAAHEKQLLLSRLVARFAHEVRNPLSSLDIHVQLLEEDLSEAGQLKEKTAGRFEIIRGELHRLENIVKHFLSLAGPSSLELQTVEVPRIVSHVCDLLRPEAAARQIELAPALAPAIPAIMADPMQLTQALVNLVINAIQAVEEKGWVRLSVDVDKNLDLLVLQVRDSGPGVAEDKQAVMFEPFFTTKAEGSGLGLWVVQQIITAHGGAIAAGNAPEGGAVFAIQLPINGPPSLHG
jgi:signal transduction histidine kinase